MDGRIRFKRKETNNDQGSDRTPGTVWAGGALVPFCLPSPPSFLLSPSPFHSWIVVGFLLNKNHQATKETNKRRDGQCCPSLSAPFPFEKLAEPFLSLPLIPSHRSIDLKRQIYEERETKKPIKKEGTKEADLGKTNLSITVWAHRFKRIRTSPLGLFLLVVLLVAYPCDRPFPPCFPFPFVCHVECLFSLSRTVAPCPVFLRGDDP
mmetsp:Transcript_234/g.573  ORF Transcript_234/g.573 Transcript_234/m.573 type:complete len:207 (+) Transcript_234:2442-3062(+)